MSDELKRLKAIVRQYLHATQYVPYRAVDCDQVEVCTLRQKLRNATKAKRTTKAKSKK